MKKFFIKFGSLFVVCLSLLAGAFVFGGEKQQKINEVASAAYYESDSSYLYDLFHNGEVLESSYNLTKRYPLIQENQTDSNLCWIYSSLKSLESSFMVQTGEFYNFSEVGQEYLNYSSQVDDGYNFPEFDSIYGGGFSDFVSSYQENGLILESDFSNTEIEEMRNNDDKYDYYSYVKDYATKQFNSSIKPYYISNMPYFLGLSIENKRDVVKKYIKHYGGLFAGIEGSPVLGGSVGCFYYDNNAENSEGLMYFYDEDRSKYDGKVNSYEPLPGNHAITIVGWNDNVHFGTETGAFLVMNSWGFETPKETPEGEGSNSNGPTKPYSFFYIPYSYENFYKTFAGFVCDDTATQGVKLESSSDSSFTTDILSGSAKLKNYYCYDDNISLTYKLDLVTMANVDIQVSSGSRVFTDLFNIIYGGESKTVTLTLRQGVEYFYGGYYTINFYENGQLFGKQGLYIFSGTEIGNFKVGYNTARYGMVDSFSLNNAFLNADSTTTINVSGHRQRYFLTFNLIPPLSYYNIITSNSSLSVKPFTVSISEVSIISSTNETLENLYSSDDLVAEDGESSWELRNALLVRNFSQEKNEFIIQIGYYLTLDDIMNSMVRFKISINSILYEDCSKDFYFNMFVSEQSYAQTDYLNTIIYELNGGENNQYNPTKYPMYKDADRVDPNMTSVDLIAPTKSGFKFVGWYLNPDFSGNEIVALDSSLSGNIKLYAKWTENLVDYFYADLNVEQIKDYSKQNKSLSDGIVYGDTVTLRFDVIENPDADVSGYDYQINYYFYGIDLVSGVLPRGNRSGLLELEFPKLQSGEYEFRLRVVVYITHNLTYTTETSIRLNVAKKLVKFGFDDLTKIYNGEVQSPSVRMIEDFYAEDKLGLQEGDLFVLTCPSVSKNHGDYNYYISSVFSKNYTYDLDDAQCVFHIAKKQININWKPYQTTYYDGYNHFPEYIVNDIIPGDDVRFGFTLKECKAAGDYTVNIDPETITNINYTVDDVEDFSFRIEKAKIIVVMQNTSDRVQTKIGKRKEPKFTVIGNYHSAEDLNLIVISQAKIAGTSGDYDITCSVENKSYDAEVRGATYTLTGYYYVYYQLSNGNIHSERVDEGKTPKGVTKEDFDAPLFSSISYSEEFDNTGEDIYVSVTLNDYSGIVYGGGFVGVFGLVCLIYYLKKRESKVR